MCWYDRRNTDDTKANVMIQSLNLKENKEKPELKMWNFRVDGFEYTKLSGK